MKTAIIILFCCCIANISYAAIKGNAIHFDVNDEFVNAFENCMPYRPKILDSEELAKNDESEEYDSIEVKGERNGVCVFNLIMQMSSKRYYFKTVKRCKATLEQKNRILESIKEIRQDKGKRYLKEIDKIIDSCSVINDTMLTY